MSWRRREAIRRGVDPKDVKDGPGNKDEWAMMRCCVPLDRVTIKGVQDYHSFATLVGLDVELDEQRNVWHPEKIAGGDFTSNDEVRSSRVKDLVKTVTGLDAPRRSFSFRNSIPFVKRSNSDQSPDRKLERSLSMGFPFHKAKAEPQMDSASTSASTPESVNSPSPAPIRRESTTWIDFTIPPVLAEGTSYATDWRDSFAFNVAVLNEQAWFVEALEAAVAAAAERKYRHDAARPKMSLVTIVSPQTRISREASRGKTRRAQEKMRNLEYRKQCERRRRHQWRRRCLASMMRASGVSRLMESADVQSSDVILHRPSSRPGGISS